MYTPSLLIVDDELAILSLLEEAFTDEGYAVRTAQNGIEAMAILSQVEPTAIILDLNMPGMSGSDVIRRIHEMESAIPCIVITADLYGKQQLRDLEVAAYFEKPFDFQELILTVERICGAIPS